jgi:hypothetical protein
MFVKLARLVRLSNWARAAGFFAFFTAAIVCSFLWAISYPQFRNDTQPNSDHAGDGRDIEYNASNLRNATSVPPMITLRPAPKSDAEVRREQEERSEKAANERGLTVATWILAFAKVLLFMAVAVQAALFIWQLLLIDESLRDAKTSAHAAMDSAKATQESVEVSKLSMIAGSRAYVNYYGCRWISHKVDSEGTLFWRIRPRWINKGNTPARAVATYAHYELLDKPLDDSYQFVPASTLTPSAMIAPDGVIESGPRNFLGSELLSVKQRTKYLYIWGVATYRDVFPGTDEYITKFCVFATDIFGNPTLPWDENTNPFDIALANYHRHNCMDEDCVDEPT